MNQLKELNMKDMSSMYSSVLDSREATMEVMNPEDQHQKEKKSMKHKDRLREVSWIWLVEGSLGELSDDSDVTGTCFCWGRYALTQAICRCSCALAQESSPFATLGGRGGASP